MIELELQQGRHWVYGLMPSQVFKEGFAVEKFFSPILQGKIRDWMEQQSMWYQLHEHKVAHVSKKFQVVKATIEFRNESDAVLFKLTWL